MPDLEQLETQRNSSLYALVAHQRTAHSPLHNWLWDQITCTIRDLRTPLSRKIRQRVAAGSAGPTSSLSA